MPEQPNPSGAPPRIPSLDGLRALSITAVILGHASGTTHFPVWLARVFHNELIDLANLGVRVFFVISGFLITGLLQAEHKKYGDVSLARFFFRRTFRIFPAYLFFVAVIVLLSSQSITSVTARDLAHVLTYTTNYYAERSWDIGHLWSLAVEEQFYLLWPLAVSLLGFASGRRVLVAVVVAIPLVRVAQSMLLPGLRPLIGTSFETTADALAMGCLLAILQGEIWGRANVRRVVERWWVAAVLLVLGALLSIRYRPGLLVGTPVINVAVVLLVTRAVKLPESGVGKILNSKFLAFLGTLSYSLYLWQQIFLNRELKEWWTAFPQNLGLAFGAALLSFYLIERPFLRWREGLEQRLFPKREPKRGA